MRAPILTVFLKELRDGLRDRRTVLMVLVASLLTGPLTLVLLAHFVSSLEEKGATLTVVVAHQEHAPALVNFLQRNDVQIERAPDDYEARVRDGRLDAVIVVPDDFDARWREGDGAKLKVVFDDSRSDAGPAIRRVERLLRGFNRETGMLRMMARGVSPELGQPVEIERINTATPRQRGAFLLFLIPMFALLSPLLGGMAVAIDSTAGERERGSLEPLLGNPVPPAQIIAGKWLAAWTFASGVAVITLAGFVTAAVLYAQKKLAAMMAFGTPEFLQFVAMIVPFAAMTSALQMLICTYGRSYREAQTYVSYLATAVSFVPAIVLFTGLKEKPWHLYVPVLGQQSVLSRLLRGDAVGLADWAVPSLVSAAIAALCLALLARLLADERIVFGRS